MWNSSVLKKSDSRRSGRRPLVATVALAALLGLGFSAGNALGQDTQDTPPPQQPNGQAGPGMGRGMGRRPMESVDDQIKRLTKKLKPDRRPAGEAEAYSGRPTQTDGTDSQRLVTFPRGPVQQDAGPAAELRHSDQERFDRSAAEGLRQDACRAAGAHETVARRQWGHSSSTAHQAGQSAVKAASD